MKNTKPTIMHVVWALVRAGTELNTLRVIQALAQRGYHQWLISLTSQVDRDLVADCPAEVIHAPDAGRLKTIRFLAGLVRQCRPDILHGRAFVTWKDCAAAKFLSRRRVHAVQSFHGQGTFVSHGPGWKWTAYFLKDLTDSFVAVSCDIAERMQNEWLVPDEKITQVGNGIDTARFSPGDKLETRRRLDMDPRAFVVGSVGSLIDVKNPALLLEGFSIFHRHCPAGQLHWVGQGPLADSLKQRAKQLRLEHAVFFHGRQKQVADYLRAMDLYVQTSSREGSPTAVMEAMACGLPCLANRSPGCVELHEQHGIPRLLTNDDPQTLAETMMQLVCNDHERIRMGRLGACAIAEHHSFEQMIDAYEQLYCSCCSNMGEDISHVAART